MEGMADGMAPSSATQLAKARAPFRACQARQQRSRTQSCTGAFLRLPGKAATQQNAVLHGLLVLLARGGSNTLGKHGGHPARRSSSPAVIQHDGTVRRKSWPSRGYPVLWHRPLGINADVHVWSSSRRPLLHGEMHSCTRFRGVPTTLHGQGHEPPPTLYTVTATRPPRPPTSERSPRTATRRTPRGA